MIAEDSATGASAVWQNMDAMTMIANSSISTRLGNLTTTSTTGYLRT